MPKAAYTSRFGDTDKIPARIKQNNEAIDSLHQQFRNTSPKDGDIRDEILDEIADLEDWNEAARIFYEQDTRNPAAVALGKLGGSKRSKKKTQAARRNIRKRWAKPR